MLKKYLILPLILIAGMFGPFFGIAQEGRTKDISLELAPGFRHDTKMYPRLRSPAPTELDDRDCSDQSRLYQGGSGSWYGPGFHGRKMANGRIFNMHDYTVAHRRLPLGTRVCISNPQNGKWVFATVTDRGPYIHGRVVDLSKRVAQDLDIMDSGVAPVKIYVVSI